MRRDTKEKVLLLFLSGLAMSLSKSPKGYYKILNSIPKQLKEIRKKDYTALSGNFIMIALLIIKKIKTEL